MIWKRKKKEIYIKMAVISVSAVLLAAGIFRADNNREILRTESGEPIVERNRPGGGKREETLQIQVGELEEEITVEIAEEQFSETEMHEEFEKAGEELEMLVLGENQSLDEVRSDLNLIARLPDTGIGITWELDNYKVMNLQGELLTEALNENGTLVRLDAILSYKEEKAKHTFYAKLFPPILSDAESQMQRLDEEIKKLDEETKEEDVMLLPGEIDGTKVTWRYATDYRAAGILFLGMAAALFIYASDNRKKKEKEEERIRQMERDYPQLINKFTLYLGAGMPVRKAWFKLAEDYERYEKPKRTRAVYEEMVYVMHELQSGASENECYERFGERCGLTIYRKFGTLLSQNLKKGTKGLADLLKQESVNSFEERKSLARKLGEEAGTKLLLPMFLMFGMVLIIIVIPAFLSVQM